MKQYTTVYGEGEAEYIAGRSRFIACVRPIESRQEAEAFFLLRRNAHKAAAHNVPAFVLGQKQELQWASDDGEPQKSAGAPILHLLIAKELTNTAIIVTRYFGGVKLGTGGLARAYTEAALLALAKARFCDVCEQVLLNYEIEYSFYDKLANAARSGNFYIEDTAFAELVSISISTSPEQEVKTTETIANITAGTAKCLTRRVELVRKLISDN